MSANVQQGQQKAQQRPLTFADVARHVSRNPSPCFVQVRIRDAVLCARVVEVGSPNSKTDFFRVHCAFGERWVSAWNARMCSGDGRCTCDGASDGAEALRAEPPTLAPAPLGNTGVTLVGAA